MAEHVAVVLALAWWAIPLTHAVGGRAPHALVLGLCSLAPALGLTRWWQRPRLVVALPLTVAAAALLVCVASPTGWAGADVAAGYVYSALLFAVMSGYVRSAARASVVVAALLLAGIDQFGQAFLAWAGGGSSANAMTGTFYWHNPFAAFLLPPALAALAVAAHGASRLRAAAWVSAPLCVAGIVYSTSRATLGALLIGWLVLLAGASLAGARTFRRALAVSALAAAVVFVLPGPPFFAHRMSPIAGASERAANGETVAANGGYRLQFWDQAVSVATHHPVSGGGFHSLGTAGRLYTSGGWARSQACPQRLPSGRERRRGAAGRAVRVGVALTRRRGGAAGVGAEASAAC